MTKIDQSAQDRAFARLVEIALKGERCPKDTKYDPKGGIPAVAMMALTRAGRIRINIFSRNWRQVEILVGPHAGRRTAPSPDKKARIWQVVDKTGARVNGRLIDHGASRRPRPSMPGLITAGARP